MLPARVACVIVAGIAMFFVIRRIHPHALADTLHHMHAGWFAAATVLYGLLFVPASLRWHIALRLNGSAIDRGTSLRLSLIGHFFYTILFGAAGGDVAKSAVYAREHQLRLPEVLAASSLDRLLGSAGLLLFSLAAFTLATVNGSLLPVDNMSLRPPRSWPLIAVALSLLFVWLMARLRRGSLWDRFVCAFLTSGRRLIASPQDFAGGVLCGLGVQLALSGTLALNLQAVSETPVPWHRLVWTFPVGLGVRDSAALMLFGLYGVTGVDAVAASLLTATVSLLWTVVGGVLLWHETAGRRRIRVESSPSTDGTGETDQIPEAPKQ